MEVVSLDKPSKLKKFNDKWDKINERLAKEWENNPLGFIGVGCGVLSLVFEIGDRIGTMRYRAAQVRAAQAILRRHNY